MARILLITEDIVGGFLDADTLKSRLRKEGHQVIPISVNNAEQAKQAEELLKIHADMAIVSNLGALHRRETEEGVLKPQAFLTQMLETHEQAKEQASTQEPVIQKPVIVYGPSTQSVGPEMVACGALVVNYDPTDKEHKALVNAVEKQLGEKHDPVAKVTLHEVVDKFPENPRYRRRLER